MSYWVYVLLSKQDNRLYVGQTNDLDQRLKRHESGLVPATKARRPLTCIHSEQFDTRSAAMKRELFLKSLWGARAKKKILQTYLNREGAA
jgi:putative endonuclease